MLQEFSIEEETDVFGLVPASTLLHLHPLFPPNASWNLPALHSLSLRNTHVSEVPSELRRPLRSRFGELRQAELDLSSEHSASPCDRDILNIIAIII